MQIDSAVYIVDDDSFVRKSLLALMISRGIRAVEFCSAEDFLEFSAVEKPVGCIISDVRLGGMNGFQLRKKLIESGIDTPMILITGFEDSPNQNDPTLTVLEKTCGPDVLIQRVQEKLQDHSHSDSVS